VIRRDVMGARNGKGEERIGDDLNWERRGLEQSWKEKQVILNRKRL
jgi:hypothetical protein